MKEEDQPIQQPLALEVSTTPDSPLGSVGSLLPQDALAPTLAKLSLTEALLRLIPKDCNFNDFCSEALLAVMRVIKCEAGSIFEINQEHQFLFFRSSVGQSSDQLGKFSVPMGQGIAGHVAESGQPMFVDDASTNQNHLKTIQNAVGFQTRNLIAFPLVVRGKRYGVLELLNRVGELSFTQEDIEITGYFCQMFGKALESRMLISWQKKTISDSEAA